MQRPELTSKDQLEYVSNLEQKIEAYQSTQSINKLYNSLQKKIDEIVEVFDNNKITYDDLSAKDDKLFDRMFKMMDRVKSISESLIYLEERILPKETKEKEEGSILEKALKNRK